MRTLRVYDRKGDFVIEVPDDAKVTFGYFNPAAPRDQSRDYTHHDNVARQTALRIYEGKTEKSNQLACFLGVTGFRDESLPLTRMQERVTIVRQMQDDPEEGMFTDNIKRQVELRALPEGDSYR